MISCKLFLTIFLVLALSYTTSAQWGIVGAATEWECTDHGGLMACGAVILEWAWEWECHGECMECMESKQCLRQRDVASRSVKGAAIREGFVLKQRFGDADESIVQRQHKSKSCHVNNGRENRRIQSRAENLAKV
ncbi:hypothetical protein Aduo_016743 [Ancylostoma duodenale]